MIPTSPAIQIDAGTSASVPIAKLHDIGSDFATAEW
jgi:O-antigen biosynthesis protein